MTSRLLLPYFLYTLGLTGLPILSSGQETPPPVAPGSTHPHKDRVYIIPSELRTLKSWIKHNSLPESLKTKYAAEIPVFEAFIEGFRGDVGLSDMAFLCFDRAANNVYYKTIRGFPSNYHVATVFNAKRGYDFVSDCRDPATQLTASTALIQRAPADQVVTYVSDALDAAGPEAANPVRTLLLAEFSKRYDRDESQFLNLSENNVVMAARVGLLRNDYTAVRSGTVFGFDPVTRMISFKQYDGKTFDVALTAEPYVTLAHDLTTSRPADDLSSIIQTGDQIQVRLDKNSKIITETANNMHDVMVRAVKVHVTAEAAK